MGVRNGKRLRGRTVAIGLAAIVVVLGGVGSVALLAGGSGSPGASYLPVVVGLGGSTIPVKIGVIVSAESDPNQGEDYYRAAAGVRIAEYRYRQAGAKVTVTVVDDHGTPDGARAAARQLLADGVDAVVYASVGTHLAAGLNTLNAAGTCSVLPYADESYTTPGKVWLTGPSLARRAQVLAQIVQSENLGVPEVISDGSLPPLVSADLLNSHVQTVSNAAQVSAPTNTSGVAGEQHPIMVWASAQLTADLIARVGGFGHTGITLVGPEAMTPSFAAALLATSLKQGTVSATNRYLTAGAPTALMGQRATDFVAAQQLASQDSNTPGLLGAEPLGVAAFAGDMLSHDAVVALVNAARRSTSPTPATTCKHLQGQQVVGGNGLAGPDLSFATTEAFPDRQVVEVQAAQTRQVDQSVKLVWFPVSNGAAPR
jgi:hypothetical protein